MHKFFLHPFQFAGLVVGRKSQDFSAAAGRPASPPAAWALSWSGVARQGTDPFSLFALARAQSNRSGVGRDDHPEPHSLERP
jgi:hypothetical protein